MSDHHEDEYAYEQPMPGEGRPQSNVLGIVGFILAFCISPVGLIISLIALRKPPRGLAIGGVVVGLLGTVVWAVLIAGGVYALGQPIVRIQNEVMTDYVAIDEAVGDYQAANGTLPGSIDELTTLTTDERTDPWGNLYALETAQAGTWSLRVTGPDGQANTADDLVLEGGLDAMELAFKFQRVTEDWNEAARAAQQQQAP